ncbi:MAG: transposase, partial [bacterium]
MTKPGRKRHTPEQIVRKLRDADAMLNAGKELAVVLQTLEVSEATFHRWRNQYGGMKSEAAKRLKQLEDENKRQNEIEARLSESTHGKGCSDDCGISSHLQEVTENNAE